MVDEKRQAHVSLSLCRLLFLSALSPMDGSPSLLPLSSWLRASDIHQLSIPHGIRTNIILSQPHIQSLSEKGLTAPRFTLSALPLIPLLGQEIF